MNPTLSPFYRIQRYHPEVRNARKTIQWIVFSGERAAAPRVADQRRISTLNSPLRLPLPIPAALALAVMDGLMNRPKLVSGNGSHTP